MPANAHLRIMAPQISISSPDDPIAAMCEWTVIVATCRAAVLCVCAKLNVLVACMCNISHCKSIKNGV